MKLGIDDEPLVSVPQTRLSRMRVFKWLTDSMSYNVLIMCDTASKLTTLISSNSAFGIHLKSHGRDVRLRPYVAD